MRRDLLREHLPEGPLPDAEAPLPQPTVSLEQVTVRLPQVALLLQNARSQLDTLTGQLRSLGSADDVKAQLVQRQQEMTQLLEEYDAVALAMEVLDEANTTLQNRFSPALGARAAEIFAQLTDNRYDAVTLDRSFRLMAEPQGSYTLRDAQFLSAGAADQLYLAVRLAICELVLPQEEPAPLILDDALTNFDDARCAAALAFLRREAKQRQILLFTCHSREAALLRDAPDVRARRLPAR